MTCEEFKEQVDAWALGALDADEAAACEAHLRGGSHEGCVEALAKAREVAASLAGSLPSERPSGLVWDRIERVIGAKVSAPVPIRAAPQWRKQIPWGLAAAAAILAAVLGISLRQEKDARQADLAAALAARQGSESSLAKVQEAARQADTDRLACLKEMAGLRTDSQLQRDALALLEDPATKVVTFASQVGEGYRASALVNTISGRALVLSSGMVLKPGSDFELWIIRGKAAPKPAGFLHSRPDGTAVGEIDRALLAEGALDALAVSLEPKGGSLVPTQVLLVGAMKS